MHLFPELFTDFDSRHHKIFSNQFSTTIPFQHWCHVCYTLINLVLTWKSLYYILDTNTNVADTNHRTLRFYVHHNDQRKIMLRSYHNIHRKSVKNLICFYFNQHVFFITRTHIQPNIWWKHTWHLLQFL